MIYIYIYIYVYIYIYEVGAGCLIVSAADIFTRAVADLTCAVADQTCAVFKKYFSVIYTLMIWRHVFKKAKRRTSVGLHNMGLINFLIKIKWCFIQKFLLFLNFLFNVSTEVVLVFRSCSNRFGNKIITCFSDVKIFTSFLWMFVLKLDGVSEFATCLILQMAHRSM